MKLSLSLVVVTIFFICYPPRSILANTETYYDKSLKDSVTKLRKFADSQMVNNFAKYEKLEIMRLQLELMNLKK